MAESQPQSHPADGRDSPVGGRVMDAVHDKLPAQFPGQFAGGFDSTPVPHAPPGYTLKFTFHRGVNLPLADFGTFSSDPYVAAQLVVDLPPRHKQDPKVTYRTPTVHRDTHPTWDSEWVVANVPASGFELKCRLYDEDSADHDDKLGNAYFGVPSIGDDWPGIKEQSVKVKQRMAGKRVYLMKNVAALASRRHGATSYLVVSVENLGRTPGAEGGQVYTVGPNYWFKHFSPLIGRLAGTKDEALSSPGEKGVARYNFQAVQIQLQGPVPSPLYHRYVEFRPFVAGMFTSQSLKGWILNRALHHQHVRVYNFDRTTQHGEFASPCVELTQKFLEFAHYGQGRRIFTYVLTLDGHFRFTETGKEFGIDLLSKHTMHSDVSIYIAYSGEFFVGRRRHHHHHHRHHGAQSSESDNYRSSVDIPTDVSTNPADYELFIDNDSGTYRPNPQYLHLLRDFVSANFPGLHVSTLDCVADAEQMKEMKDERREFKKKEGLQMTLLQQSSSSLSISSSEEEELDERSGLSQKQRGELSRKARDMRDVKGQVMKWAQAEGHADGRGRQPNSNGLA